MKQCEPICKGCGCNLSKIITNELLFLGLRPHIQCKSCKYISLVRFRDGSILELVEEEDEAN